MKLPHEFQYVQGRSLSELFAQDLSDTSSAFILNYPATASWAAYPNTKKYFLQDGNDETTKTSYDKVCQKEPWKNLAVLGDRLPGILLSPPSDTLLDYWREHFGFRYDNLELMQRRVYLDELNQGDRFERLITLFPFDGLLPDKHAIDPDVHYRMLSKATLSELGVSCPNYSTYPLHQMRLDELHLPDEFPFLIKTSHGLSGEGTYIIRNLGDLKYCLQELKKYLDINLLETIVVSDYIRDVIGNYCVQFYINRAGEISLIGVTQQIVNSEGDYLGGLIHYRETEVQKFYEMIAAIGQYANQHGYFGVVGFDVLEDQDGQLYAIDVNFRVNGSTPLCLQRQALLSVGKEVANYATNYCMDGTLDSILVTLKPELERKDFLILSALEKAKYGRIHTELYGIVAGKTLQDLRNTEQELHRKHLRLVW